MKQKPALTVERPTVQAARRQGTGISAIFEKTFITPASTKPGFAERWLNKFPPAKLPTAADFKHDHRYAHLLAKYVKPAPRARAD